MTIGAAQQFFLGASKATGGGGAGYQIERSLRFNSSDSAYLSRTPGSAGNRKTFTFSCWVKKATNGSYGTLFECTNNSTFYTLFRFQNDETFTFYDEGQGYVRTTAVFRDSSAWYHLVIAVDTTQAVNSNRVKIYVNGSQVTNLAVSNYPTQNADTSVNTATLHIIGARYDTSGYALGFNGYLADIYFIDGQALTPSSFTEVSATTGQLIPKAYTGTFTGNSFWLKFADNSAATATTLGKDSSGLGNNWTPNNFSVTAGAGNDSLVDTPTSYGTDTGAGGEVRGNYCTLSPLIATSGPISNGNLEMVGANAWRNTKGTISLLTGKWYFEATYSGGQFGSAIGNLVAGVGFAKSNTSTPNVDVNDSSLYGSILAFSQTGHVNNFNAPTSARSQIANGDVIGFALNYDAGTYTIYVNNTSTSSGSLNFAGELTPWTNAYYSSSYFILNFGQRPFAYPVSGFKALCDTNLISTTITTSGSYTGNGVADGPFVYLNGVPTAMTIGGNAVTFGTHADKLANGFKIRTSSTTYNQNASSYSYSITSTGAAFKNARAQPNP